jgi:hypothetical protein
MAAAAGAKRRELSKTIILYTTRKDEEVEVEDYGAFGIRRIARLVRACSSASACRGRVLAQV